MISRAGGEGLDLKATNILYILDPSWNQAAVQQIVGRAVRRNSHKDLPPDQRFVLIYTLNMLKPFEGIALSKFRRDGDRRYEQVYEKIFDNPEVLGEYPEEVIALFTTEMKTSMKKVQKKKQDTLDSMMSIDLYLYKYIKRKQKELDKFMELIRAKSHQSFDMEIRTILRDLKDYVPIRPVEDEFPVVEGKDEYIPVETMFEKGTRVIEASIEANIPFDKTLPAKRLSSLPVEVRALASAELKEMDTIIKYFLVVDRPKAKLVVFYKNDAGKVIRENILLK
jgi:hypothetical protein